MSDLQAAEHLPSAPCVFSVTLPSRRHSVVYRDAKGWHGYDRINQQDRDVVDAVANWLRPIPWQWFATLTFHWNVRSETADLKLRQWINTIERETRERMCYVFGKEKKGPSLGKTVPWHFHLLATSKADLPKELLESVWQKLVGKGERMEIDGDVNYDSILVEPYSTHQKGAEYCLKSLGDSGGEWGFRWLDLFNPKVAGTARPSHRSVRQRARFDVDHTQRR
jgi:hypothetical protein